MGKTVGVICEYNPFHNGHARQLAVMRRSPDDLIVCVMSGHAVQRGEVAITDKYTRAAMALACGADLVLELPFPYSASSADYFAQAGVRLLASVGAEAICFGAETPDVEKLVSIADRLTGASFTTDASGYGSGAFFEALAAIPGAERLGPNDLLALAYLRVMRRVGYTPELIPILREGTPYRDADAPITADLCPSAAALRRAILQGDDYAAGIPAPAAKILQNAFSSGSGPADPSKTDAALLTWLRLADPEKIAGAAECGGGVAERILSRVREVRTLSELYEKIATKAYTHTRLRRAILFAVIGVTPEDLSAPPAYTQLLGANERGRALLANLRKNPPPIPILTKPADVRSLKDAARQASLSLAADALFAAALPEPCPADFFMKRSPVMI